jgi:hypothetical protein
MTRPVRRFKRPPGPVISSGLRPFKASCSASAGSNSASRSTTASGGLSACPVLLDSLSRSEMELIVMAFLPGHKGRISHHDHTHFTGQTPLMTRVAGI